MCEGLGSLYDSVGNGIFRACSEDAIRKDHQLEGSA
jgi:hypothetical protein